ncbi:MAG: Double zinc ribbon [Syntrophus sp. PtaU1.Bin005]|jgi:membrane protease subunit (stomatin/prohibitin family)|uniref:SPFH domain-containing protein n=1 Tax=Syntrophus TaxID=43773 RepID=UPI0009D0E58D|nr:MAG: Double zinc ribbon [Syntrophus sp. PtaB.Bin138]OPY78071.1 MAG: Double zinc ribbon [Syntrophus sp. PtaU1.Bin005]
MGTDNLIFLEVLEWFDESGRELVHRIPEAGSGEIKWGAQLTVRESQAAVFFYNGRACDVLGPGRHTLKTANLPILTKILSIPWGMRSPLRAEVFFVSKKVFPNLKWGTRDPAAFRDAELGLIRLRAFGMFNIRVLNPLLFINELVGTQGVFTTEAIAEYLNSVIVSFFNDYMGENIDTIFNLPARYSEMSGALRSLLEGEFSRFGLELEELYINAITPPPDVQKAIDDKSRLGVFGDLNSLVKMKAAMAMENASSSQGEAGAGLGMGIGLMMPGLFAESFRTAQSGSPPPPDSATATSCPVCRRPFPPEAKFCPHCGSSLAARRVCSACGAALPEGAKFCSACGAAAAIPASRTCGRCGTANDSSSVFCHRCGERL